MTTPAPMPPAPPAPDGKRKLSTGAIVGIVVGSIVLLGIIGLGALFVIAKPVFDSERARAYDSAAKADVSTLGKDIATHMVDNSTPPVIRVEDGNYLLDGAAAPYDHEPVSEGVEFGGQSGDNYGDWCVWVTAPDGNLKDFRYSALGGLEAARC